MHTMLRVVLLAGLSMAAASAQPFSGDLYLVEKGHDFTQISVNTTIEGGFPNPWFFGTDIMGDGVNAGTPSPPNTITPPGGSPQSLTFDSSEEHWQYGEFNFATQAALDAAYPNGTYVFTAGGNTANISLAGNLYPGTPLGTVSAGVWSGNVLMMPANTAFSIESNTFGANFLADFVRMAINIDKVSGPGTFEGMSTEIYPSSSSATVLLNMLAEDVYPGSVYEVEISFNRILDPISFNGGTNNAFGLYSTITSFQIQTAPEPASWAIFAGALALGAAWRMRRRAAAA